MALPKELLEYYKSFTQHGAGENLVQLEPQELALLVCIAFYDVNGVFPDSADEPILRIARKPYYTIVEGDIENLPSLTIEQAVRYLEITDGLKVSEFSMYVRKLADLHRKRFKYRTILKNQPFPTAEQIGPRSLLEFGNCDNRLLFNWMTWRKWSYDIDNRSAQETGYLFEPILVSCIGGETISHSKSPVKRLDESGNQTSEGRQIDCFIQHENESLAYELKMRVTIAASGQGRFNEEMTFPVEAKKAGIVPVLVVFDPTESTLLSKLTNAYLANGGRVFIGENAWNHLKVEAGRLMGTFIAKYIEPPILGLENSGIELPYAVKLEATENSIIISDTSTSKYVIRRKK